MSERRYLLTIWLAVLLSACQVSSTRAGLPAVATQSNGQATSPHFLLSTGMGAVVKRHAWTQYLPVEFGAALQDGDLLKIEGQARILCADLHVNTISGIDSVPCRTASGVLKYRGADFLIPRAAPGDVPYVLFPRNTLLLDSRPQLRWHDTGAGSYSVAIRNEQGKVWSLSGVVSTTLDYPTGESSLAPGVTYSLWVRDDDTQHTSDEAVVAGFGFQVADATVQQRVQETCGLVATLPELDSTGREFAYAVCLASLTPDEHSGFAPIGEALLRFEQLALQRPTPAVLLWHADMLAATDLVAEARTAYAAALAAAERLGDIESQLEATKSLWCLATNQKLGDELASRAMQLAQALGPAQVASPSESAWCESP